MELKFSTLESVGVVTVNGSLDTSTAAELNEYVSTQISAGHSQLVLDLSQVEFMSSAGLRAILVSLKECRREGGDLRLAAAQPGTEKVLKISGFLSIIKSYPSVGAALVSFNE
jgi:anti-sigma B factor antagonist